MHEQQSKKRHAHGKEAEHAKQHSETLNATVRPSSEGASSKEANRIMCATDWLVQGVAKRHRAWQHHAPKAQQDTHPYSRSSNASYVTTSTKCSSVMCSAARAARPPRAPNLPLPRPPRSASPNNPVPSNQ